MKALGTIVIAGVGNVANFITRWIDKVTFERDRNAKLIKKKRDLQREYDDLKVKYHLMKEILDESKDACETIESLQDIVKDDSETSKAN